MGSGLSVPYGKELMGSGLSVPYGKERPDPDDVKEKAEQYSRPYQVKLLK
jgi:hypothetical protein